MFSKLISRNSRRSRKENGLFFSSLIVSVIAFYIILSLSHQDVMIFLSKMEGNAVDKVLVMVPVFYCMTLFILFFLIYYASKFQLERRRHEFGVCLMMGMRRTKLFWMLLAEDFRGSAIALLIGLPAAVLLSELISLITARLVGLGIVGHQSSFSMGAVLWTAAGFVLVKFAAFLILSGRISRQEIGSLLVDTPEGAKGQMPASAYAAAILAGVFCLSVAYAKAIRGEVWSDLWEMGITVSLGIFGTIVFFFGLRFLIGIAVKAGKNDRRLHVFNLRQIEETVICRSNTLAVCSLLILAALCCFGVGVAISRFYGAREHVLDYTFQGLPRNALSETPEWDSLTDDGERNSTAAIRQALADHQLDTRFSSLFEMKVGHIRTTDDTANAFQMEAVMSALREMPDSQDRDVLLGNLKYATYPYVISEGSYNRLLDAAGLPELALDADEAAVYMDETYASGMRRELFDRVLETRPEVRLDEKMLRLTGTVQSANLVTDRSVALSFALILPDELFAYYTQGEYSVYLNGILEKSMVEDRSLMSAILDMNRELDGAGLSYESYLQNMGRQLFYKVAASYITIYLAIVFLIIANTVIGVQFLISQQKSSRRYRTLISLGAVYATLCRSARKQINWYFGIPIAVAVCSSLFGVRALLTGILSYRVAGDLPEMMAVSAVMILALCLVECIYIAVVKRSSDRYLLTLMVPEREE